MIDIVDAGFAYIAPYIGISKDQLKLVTILYAAVPLCAVLKRLPDNQPHLKNVFNIWYESLGSHLTNISVSLFILVGVYDLWNGLWILLIGAVGTYVLTFRLKG